MAKEDNEFDPVIEAMKGNVQRKTLASTLESVFDINPDKAAETQRLAASAGLNPVEVEGREQEVAHFEKLKAAGVDAIVEKFPSLRSSLEDKNFASISHDDFERLKQVEEIAPVLMKGESNTLEGLSNNYDVAKRRYPALLGLAYGLGDEEALAQAYVDSINDQDKLTGREPNYIREYQRDSARSSGFLGEVGALIKNPRATTRMAVEQLPVSTPAILAGIGGSRVGAVGGAGVGSIVPGVGTGAGAAVGGTVGFATGTFLGSAPYDVADWMEQSMQKAGVNTRDPAAVRAYLRSDAFQKEAKAQAEIKGLTNSAITAVYTPFAGRYIKPGMGVRQAVVGGAAGAAENTVVTAGAEATAQYAATGTVDGKQVAQEAILELPASTIEVAASANEARATGRSKPVAGSDAPGGGQESAAPAPEAAQPSPLREAVKTSAETLAARKEAEIRQVHDTVRQSKTVQRNPEAFRDFVAKAAPNENVYIDGAAAVTFFQTLPDNVKAEIEAAVPDIKDKLVESAAAGTDIPVTKADYMAFIAPHEESETLAPFIRFGEDDYTIDDLRNIDDLVDEAEELGLTDDTTALEPEEVLARRLESELMQAGLTPDAARLDASLARSAYTAFGDYTNSEEGQRFIQDAFGRLTIRAPQSAPRVTNADRGYVKGMREYLKGEQRKKAARKVGGKVRDMFGAAPRKERAKPTPKPVIAWLTRNGIQRGSPVAKELAAIGVTPEKYPGLYTTEERGLRDLDNIPKVEFDNQFADIGLVADDDGNGYVDRQYLLETLRDEDFGKGAMTPEQKEREARGAQYKQVQEYLDRFHDIDVMTASEEQIMAALRDFDEVTAQEPSRTLYQTMPQPAFYSAISRAVEGVKQERADAQQWFGIISNAPGVKAEEIEWTGLREWLADQEGQVRKDEVQAFLNAGGVQIQEIEKADQFTQDDENLLAQLEDRAPDAVGGQTFEQWAADNVAGEPTDADRARFEQYQEMGDPVTGQRPGPNGGSTRYSKFQIPGGDNYRELLLTLPEDTSQPQYEWKETNGRGAWFLDGQQVSGSFAVEGLDIENVKAMAKGTITTSAQPGANNYRSQHYDEKNVLAHVRFNERRDAEGNRVLFLEEVQSDWHQAGRKKGYKISDAAWEASNRRLENALAGSAAVMQKNDDFGFDTRNQAMAELRSQKSDFFKNYDVAEEDRAALQEYLDAKAENMAANRDDTVPDAPFKKTWHELAMKRMLRYAAENGFDRIAWTTGEQQAERYDLSKRISSIHAIAQTDRDGNKTGRVTLSAYDFNDYDIIGGRSMAQEDMADYIGKDMAEKVAEQLKTSDRARLEGLDLKVGGDGMKGFYDKILPNFANKYAKKWGSKVEDVTFDYADGETKYVIDAEDISADPDAEQTVRVLYRETMEPVQEEPFKSFAEAEAWVDSQPDDLGFVAHGMDITDAMRESVMAGQPLFQGTQRDPLGSIAYLPDGRTIINLFERSNLSTALHEMGHFYWGMLDKMNEAGLLNERGVKDWQTIRDHVGAKEGEALTVDQEEEIARSFEAYLRTGKAPSLELQEAFQRFKAWLIRIYKELRDLNVNVTPEVAAVFDRMLATDAQIEAMKDNKLFRADPAVMEMLNEEQQRQYVRQAERAIETAKEKLLAKALRQAEKSNTGPYKKMRKEVTAEVKESVSNAAVYKALDAMQKGELADGTKFEVKPRLDRKAVKELMGQDTVNSMPRATLTRGGLDPDIVADMFGFVNGRALIDALVSAPDKKTRIEQNVDRIMQERFGNMLNDGTIEREALDSFHNADRAAMLELELKYTADKAGIRAATTREFQLAAARILGGKTVDNVMKSERFYYAEVKAAREYGRAVAKKDWARAADAKRRQLLNHHLLRQAESAKREVDSALRKFKKLAKPLDPKRAMKIDEDYHNRIQQVLAAYSYGPRMSNAKRTKLEMQTLAAWAQQKQIDDDALVDIPPELMETDKAHYRDLSLDDFRALRDTVLNIEKQGRKKREYIIDGKKREMASVVAEAEAVMATSLPVRPVNRNPSKVGRLTSQYFAALVKGREYLRQLDGGEVQGIFYKAVLRDIDAGMNRFVTRQKEAGEVFQDILKKRYSQKELYAMVKDGKVYDGLGTQAITKENLLLMALNWGNEGNREALLHGEGWRQEDVENALATLEKRDWEFVQDVWDMVNGYWPEISALEKRRKGVTPKKVEGDPFYAEYATATPGPNGGTTSGSMQMKGGYFPISPDPSRSVRAQEQSADQWAREMSMGMGAASMTRRNHTKARVGTGQEARPLWLSFGVIPRHMNMVLRDLELGEATHNAQRFLRQPAIKMGVVDRLGMEAYTTMDLWLKDVAVGDLPTGDAFTAIVDRLRANASIAYMGFSISTLVQQFTGLTNSAAAMGSGGRGWKWVGVGLKQLRRAYSRDGEMNMAAIYEASEFMANRAATMTRDINETMQLFEGKVGNKLGLPPGYQKIFLMHIQKAQSIVDAATWLGALEQARRDGKADDVAVEYADNIVRSQASGLMQDLSGLERGSFTNANRFNRWAKMFTFMYSYYGAKFNLAYGKVADYRAGRASAIEATVDIISLIWVDALLSAMVMGRLPDEDDGDDDFAVRWLKWMAQQPANMFPMVREVSSALQGFDGSAGGAFGGFVKAASDLYTQVDQGEVDAALARATVMFAGLAIGLPATQINRLINVAERAADGKDVGYIDFVRSRKPSER